MAWYGWLVLTVSLAGWLATARRLAWKFYGKPDPYTDDVDLGCSIFFGLAVALAWPLIVLAYYMIRLNLSPPVEGFLRAPPHVRKQAKQLKARELQARIKELERELNIK